MKFVGPWTVHDVHWLAEKNRKVKVCGYCSLNSTWTVATVSPTREKKKKKRKNANAKRQTRNPNSALMDATSIAYFTILDQELTSICLKSIYFVETNFFFLLKVL